MCIITIIDNSYKWEGAFCRCGSTVKKFSEKPFTVLCPKGPVLALLTSHACTHACTDVHCTLSFFLDSVENVMYCITHHLEQINKTENSRGRIEKGGKYSHVIIGRMVQCASRNSTGLAGVQSVRPVLIM